MSKNTNTTEVTITPAMNKVYQSCTNAIRNAQGKADGLARTIAKSLTRLADTKAYEAGGYKNIYDYSAEEHGISRGTTSDAINVFRTFANESHEEIAEEWKPYAWSVLIMLKKYDEPDKLVEMLGITPETTRAEVKKKLDEYEQSLLPMSMVEINEESESSESSTVEQSDNEETEANEANAPVIIPLSVNAQKESIGVVIDAVLAKLLKDPYTDIIIRRVTD